jgi:deoxyribose-phosphate aldolase
VKIKAAGGVRTLDDLLRVRALGVDRVGATTTETILQEAIKRGLPGPLPEGLKKEPAPVPATASKGY